METLAPPSPPAGRIDGQCHLFPLRVYFEDTDLAGVVDYANYLKYAERARSDLLRLLGIDQRAAMEQGAGVYVVAEAHIRYLRSARLDDALLVETRAIQLRNASAKLSQRVLRGGDVLAEMTINVGFIGPDGRLRRQPAAWREAFEQFAAQGPETT